MRKLMLIMCALLLTAGMIALTGCQTATPSKAQIAEIKADQITVTSGGAAYCALLNSYTNLPPEQFVVLVDAVSALASATECNVISQSMTNETGGDESNSQTATGPSTPVDVSVPTGTDAVRALVGAGAEGVVKGMKTPAQANPDCPDGDCAPSE